MSKRTLPSAPRVTVRVGQDEIDTSVKADSTSCMVVDAIYASYPDASRVTVDAATIRFSDHGRGLRYTYLTPTDVRNKIIAWDMGAVPEPWTFQLRNGRTTRIRRRDPATGKRSRQGPGQDKGMATAQLVSRKNLKNPEAVGGEPPPTGPLASGAGVRKSDWRVFGLRSAAIAIEEAQKRMAG